MGPIYPVPPGLFCVPSALIALTGEDYESVIQPAINRAQRAYGLRDEVRGAYWRDAVQVLRELGYIVRPAKSVGRETASQWAQRAIDRGYPAPLFLGVRGHVMVAYEGQIYDNHKPWGADHDRHPWSGSRVTESAIVYKS